jgi:hypothetical protein
MFISDPIVQVNKKIGNEIDDKYSNPIEQKLKYLISETDAENMQITKKE